MSDPPHDTPDHPGPSLWPIGFAVGIACLLLGLVINWIIAAIGAVLALAFGLLWARDVTRGVREEAPEIEPETRTVADAAPPPAPAPAAVVPSEAPTTYTRSKFLEASTIGVGATIGVLVTLPVLGFMVLPSFTDQTEPTVDLGPLDNFPQDEFVIAKYYLNAAEGDVTRRTAFVRYNGLVANPAHAGRREPSFTILYSRCVHLGCPVQANGPVQGKPKKIADVELQSVLAQSFGCPCHGGQYNSEGNRTAGPPVRSMDRYEYSIINNHLILGQLYSVGSVEGTGAQAVIAKYSWASPGVHVTGAEAWLYPIVPSQVTS